MPHVSKYRLSKDQVDQLGQQIVNATFSLKNKNHLQLFLNDLLSTTEKIMLGKRFVIAVMIERGDAYMDIKRRLGVTDVTIATVSERLKREGGGLRLAIKEMQRRENIDKMLGKFLGPVIELTRSMPKIAYVSRRRSLHK